MHFRWHRVYVWLLFAIYEQRFASLLEDSLIYVLIVFLGLLSTRLGFAYKFSCWFVFVGVIKYKIFDVRLSVGLFRLPFAVRTLAVGIESVEANIQHYNRFLRFTCTCAILGWECMRVVGCIENHDDYNVDDFAIFIKHNCNCSFSSFIRKCFSIGDIIIVIPTVASLFLTVCDPVFWVVSSVYVSSLYKW